MEYWMRFRGGILLFILFLGFTGLNAILFAETVPQKVFHLRNPRMAAMGGLHATMADDLMALWNNPAGLYEIESQFRISEATFNLGGPVFSLSNILLRAAGGEDVDVLLTDPDVLELVKGIYTSFDMAGPISFGYVGKGLGFAILNGSSIEAKSVGSTTFGFSVSERILLYGGYAFRVYPFGDTPVDTGINLKTLVLGTTAFQRTLLEVPDLANEGVDLLMSSPFSLTSGIGIDVGVLFPLGSSAKLGVVVRNLFTPTTRSDYTSLDAFLSKENPAPAVKGNVPLDLSVGVQYAPSLGLMELYFRKLRIMVDYNDSLDFLTHPSTAVNPVLKVGIGAEVQVLEVLWIRAGIFQGLLACGFGLDYGVIQVNVAVYGTEQSVEPGIRPVFNIAFGMEITLK